MPNNCETDLVITGPKKDIAAFLEAAKGEPQGTIEGDDPNLIDLQRLVPMPDDQRENWYRWCLQNWGTKWGCYWFNNPKLSPNGRRWRVSFSSAWSPPITAFEKIAEMFPTLTFTLRFYEMGIACKGLFKVKGCEVLEQWDEKYHGTRGG